MTLELKEQGDGIGVLAGMLQRVRGHNPEGPGEVDGGYLGRSLTLSEGRQRPSIVDKQV